MLLAELAAHPTCAPALVDALVDMALAPRARSRAVDAIVPRLLAQPQVGTAQLAGLLSTAPHLARVAFARSDVIAAVAIDLLGQTPSVEVARAALELVADPGGALARHVIGARPGSVRLQSDVLRNAGAPDDLRRGAALMLAAHPRLTDADELRIVRYVRQVLVADASAGRDVAAQVSAVTRSKALRRGVATQVGYLDEPPEPGSFAWFQDAATSVADVLGWVHRARTVTAWTAALRDFPDSTGQVAAAALAAVPRARWTSERIVRTVDLPAALRQDAARALAARGSWEWAQLREAADLLRVADADFVRWFLRSADLCEETRDALAGRVDLDEHAVLVLDRARQALEDRRLASRVGVQLLGARVGHPHVWDMWLVTHPGTGAQLRAEAARRLREEVPGTGLAELWAPYVAAFTVVDGTLSSYAAAADRLAVKSVGALPSLPGVRLIGDQVTSRYAGVADTPARAATLLALADGFAGTVGELFTTVTTVAG